MKKLFRPRVFVSLLIALLATSGIAIAGAMLRDEPEAKVATTPGSTTTTTTPATTTTVAPTATTAPPSAILQPPPAQLPPLPPEGIGPGSSGEVVQAYEQRLADVKFDPGKVDGGWDTATTYAVHGLQHFRGAAVSGRLYEEDRLFLETLQYGPPLVAQAFGGPPPEANRTEIDITRGVLTLYENWQVRLLSTISTGSGEHYCYNSPRDNPTERICEFATTPSGRFEYNYFYDGWHKSPLGQLYNPYYFNKGIAVHGYQEVPPYPASHGCVRIPMHTAEYFHTLVNNGDAVYVFGGQDAVITSRTPIGGGPAPTGPPPDAIPPPGEPAPPPPEAPPPETAAPPPA
jgi:peptidoglycan hydrolase-like protein with peptidoglycan-binding domain